jgi:hypothetical protein
MTETAEEAVPFTMKALAARIQSVISDEPHADTEVHG